MNAAELIQRTQKLNDETKALQSYWSTLFPEFEALPARQCHVWLGKFRLIEIIHALDVTLKQHAMRIDKHEDIWSSNAPVFSYVSGVLYKNREER